MEELADNGSGLGAGAQDFLKLLQVGCDALGKVIEENIGEENREGLRKSRSIIQRLNELQRQQAYIDVSRAEPAAQMPTLLSCSAEDIRSLFQELPLELADVSKAWQNSKEELRSFTTRLMDESPEAKSLLLHEPAKLELLGIAVPQGR